MSFNNNSFDFNYELNVELINAETGEHICMFKARENTPLVNDANFAGGGIASGGQNYSIATNEDVHEKIKPFSQQAIVDGVEFKVLNKAVSISTLQMPFVKRKKKETIIYLG